MEAADALELRQRLVEAAAVQQAVAVEQDIYGQRYYVDFEWVRAGRRPKVRSGSIVLAGEGVPRLTTWFVPSE